MTGLGIEWMLHSVADGGRAVEVDSGSGRSQLEWLPWYASNARLHRVVWLTHSGIPPRGIWLRSEASLAVTPFMQHSDEDREI